MTVFEFAYSECIWEGGCVTFSIHETRKGAEMALDFHKDACRQHWMEMFDTKELRKEHTFGDMEEWIVRETRVKP